MQNTVEDIAKGKSLRESSRQHGVPRSTLQRRLKTNNLLEMKCGPKPLFNTEQEGILFNHILEMSSKFHGLTSVIVRKIAFELVEKFKIEHSFNKTTKLTGKDNREPSLRERV